MAGLSFQDVTHAYDGVEALRSFDLEVRDGEIVCLVGPSGCGKTTALRLAAGLEPLSHGNILVGGEHVSGGGRDWAPEERGVGLVFQDFALFPRSLHLKAALCNFKMESHKAGSLTLVPTFTTLL